MIGCQGDHRIPRQQTIVGVEEADERRVELAEASAQRAGLAGIGSELHVAKPRVAKARQGDAAQALNATCGGSLVASCSSTTQSLI